MLEITDNFEVNRPIIKTPEVADLVKFESVLGKDKKPYVSEMIKSLKTAPDDNEKILGFYDQSKTIVGIAYFLEEENNSIYLSRLITAKKNQHQGVASSLINDLKSRYNSIRTTPIPLGDDYYSDEKTEKLRQFYKKRGFKDGIKWRRVV